MRSKDELRFKITNVGCNSHFLDCGSFSHWELSEVWAKETGKPVNEYFNLKSYRANIDGYAEFVKKYKIAIDLYSNFDVIPNPELTWRNQKYLEKKHGLKPVPVVHYRTDLKWLEFYMDRGHKMISLGGLVGSHGQDNCREWIDRCFEMVCDQPSKLPKVKLHGFGVTSFPLMLRYPWWSVDSSSWAKAGGFGKLFVPHLRGGKFDFTEHPYVIQVSYEGPGRKKDGHLLNLPKIEQDIVRRWLKEINIPMGRMGEHGELLKTGVVNNHSLRKAANLLFFHRLQENIPAYPWPFEGRKRPGGFGVFG